MLKQIAIAAAVVATLVPAAAHARNPIIVYERGCYNCGGGNVAATAAVVGTLGFLGGVATGVGLARSVAPPPPTVVYVTPETDWHAAPPCRTVIYGYDLQGRPLTKRDCRY